MLQLSDWKAHHLACLRHASPRYGGSGATLAAAWRYGLRLGKHCSCSCAGLTIVLVACGAMDLRAMAIATVVITAERLAPAGERVARAVGFVAAIGGMVLLVSAMTTLG